MRYKAPLIGALAALAGGILAIASYRTIRPRRFTFEGKLYLRHPDGSFTSLEGAPVISPQLEAVKAHWESRSLRGRS
jgi:hypothetical protein